MHMTIKTKYHISVILIASVCLCMISCGKPYVAVAPKGFAVYTNEYEYRTVSPDGVLYRVRHVQNKPFADLGFWHEALKKRMVDAGYRLLTDTTYETDNSKRVLLELAAPVGNNDYLYLIDIQTCRKKIVIIEATGEAALLEARKPAIYKAMKELKLKGK